MDQGLQFFPEQASTVAAEVDALYLFLVGVTVFFTLAIFFAIVFLALYYRRAARRHAAPAHGGKLWIMEATWIVIPFLLVMAMFAWGAEVFVNIRTMPRNAIEMQVIGKQWMWKIQHPQGRSEINELHVPIGQPVVLRMISEDVIHSFFVPAFRVKMDVLPGRYSTLWFEATEPGEYDLYCTEYCGTDHAKMRGKVVAMTPTEYAEWLAGGEQVAPVTAGEELFMQFRCNTCHFAGGVQRCPPLENLFGSTVQLNDGRSISVDEDYLRESILNPNAKIVAGFQPVMPTYQGQLSEEQIYHLVEYVKSLSAAPPSAAGAAAGAPATPSTSRNSQSP